jgi:DNA polymerase gamma 1
MLTFDVEVLYKIHPYPVMAAACSPDAWYFWLSPWVTGESSVQEHLVPLGPPDIPRVVVGHNVGYDRSKILEEYHLDGTKNRFLDTLSFHAASQGVSGTQRGAWRNHWKSIKEKEKSRNSKEKELLVFIEEMEQKKKDGEEIHEWPEEVAEDAFGESTTEMKSERVDDLLARSRKVLEALPPKEKASKQRSLDLNDFDVDDSTASPLSSSSSGGGLYTESESVGKVWTDVTALNSLGEVFKLHFYGEELDKSTREAFSATSVYGVRQDLDNLIRYCASDVHATHRVFREVFPRFRKMCPSPVSFGGLLTMGSPFLPIDKSWYEYVERSEAKYLELNGSVRIKLASLAEEARLRWTPPDDDFKLPPSSDYEALERLAKPDEFEDDEWLAQLDWTPKKARWIKWKAEEKDGMSVVRKKTPVGGGESSTSDAEALVPINLKEFQTSHVVPDLIDLTWQGRPLAWSAQHGWTYKMPATSPSMEDAGGSLTFTDPRDQSLNLETTSSDPSTRVVFFPRPPLGKAAKVSKIFAKTWLKRKSNFDGLACADQELLDLVRDEADWVMIEGKIREIMSKKGMFGGMYRSR